MSPRHVKEGTAKVGTALRLPPGRPLAWVRLALMSSRATSSPALIRLIAILKLSKGLVLLGLGVATLTLRHRDVTDVLGTWVDQLHLDPGGRIVHAVLLHAADVKPRRLVAIGAGMLVYAVLLLTEGTGLWLGRRWAEYFAVILTASFLPLEMYEIARHPTATRVAVLIVNLAIVAYLVARLRDRRHRSRRHGGGRHGPRRHSESVISRAPRLEKR
jgi:uncharacterized membrane protein (DUF2068 family)